MTDTLALGLGDVSCSKQDLWRHLRGAKRQTAFWRYRTEGFVPFGIDCTYVLEMPLTGTSLASLGEGDAIEPENWSDVRAVVELAKPKAAFVAVVHLGTTSRADDVVAKRLVHCRRLSDFLDVPLVDGEARTLRIR
ncbi:MAG: hypothetical protein H6721_15125 [Sandaracinus sp.]|nr:hypothetical protein [Sandaracinus sp.]MCB9633446.1 hypothetical protein [Sandaracinus sp.]